MSAQELIRTPLHEEELARIDALAKARGLTRDGMIVELLHIGLPLLEREAEQPPHSGKDGES